VAPPQKAKQIVSGYGLEFASLSTEGVPVRRLAQLLPVLGSCLGCRSDFVRLRAFHHAAEAMLCKLPLMLNSLKPDAIVVDQNVLAGGTVATHLGIPYATLATSVLWHEEANVPPHFTGWTYSTSSAARWRNTIGNKSFALYMSPVVRLINGYRRAWKLQPIRNICQVFSSTAQISQLCSEFDFPRTQLPDCLSYVGSLGADRKPPQIDFPWERLDGRPLIFASLGTVPNQRNAGIFKVISDACVGLDAQLVLTLGRFAEDMASEDRELSSLPPDQIVVRFAPQTELLNRAAVLVTHAGVNTVLEALCRGVPMVALPRNVDHPAMATRIEFAGVGLRGSFANITAEGLRELIRRVLEDVSFRDRAQAVGKCIQAAGGVERAADIVEAML
jgi:MGT family glycosyltransferase